MITEIINSKDPKLLMLEVMLGNLCNYKCNYCFPGSNEGDSPWPDIDILVKNLDHLISVYKQQGKTKFEFFFIGGEPTLWKDFSKLCNYLKTNHNVIIRVVTNGSRKIDWWKENAKYFDQVEISVHHEYAKLDHIINVADMLYEQKVNVVTNVIMDPAAFDQCKDNVTVLKTSKRRWPILIMAVHYNGVSRYTDEQLKFFKKKLKRWPNVFWWFTLKHATRNKLWVVEDGKKTRVQDYWFLLNNKNRFKGWQCNLGVDHIELGMTGTIGGTCKEPVYGEQPYNIYADNFTEIFNPIIKPIVCGKDCCACGNEISINKKFIPIVLEHTFHNRNDRSDM